LIATIEGRLREIQATPQRKHIFLLGGGAIEHYAPSYTGDRYALNDGAKKKAVAAEIALLTRWATAAAVRVALGRADGFTVEPP
jgi:hypothetical protein